PQANPVDDRSVVADHSGQAVAVRTRYRGGDHLDLGRGLEEDRARRRAALGETPEPFAIARELARRHRRGPCPPTLALRSPSHQPRALPCLRSRTASIARATAGRYSGSRNPTRSVKMANSETIRKRLKEERIPEAFWPEEWEEKKKRPREIAFMDVNL